MTRSLIRLIVALTFTGLWLADPALAACTSHTITLPDGRMMFCTTCCSAPGQCQTSCV